MNQFYREHFKDPKEWVYDISKLHLSSSSFNSSIQNQTKKKKKGEIQTINVNDLPNVPYNSDSCPHSPIIIPNNKNDLNNNNVNNNDNSEDSSLALGTDTGFGVYLNFSSRKEGPLEYYCNESSGIEKILKYDPDASFITQALCFSGSVWSHHLFRSLVYHTGISAILIGFIIAILIYIITNNIDLGENSSIITVESKWICKSPITNYFDISPILNTTAMFNTFLLGTFMSRWWTCRQSGIGNLWGGTDDLKLLLFPILKTRLSERARRVKLASSESNLNINQIQLDEDISAELSIKEQFLEGSNIRKEGCSITNLNNNTNNRNNNNQQHEWKTSTMYESKRSITQLVGTINRLVTLSWCCLSAESNGKRKIKPGMDKDFIRLSTRQERFFLIGENRLRPSSQSQTETSSSKGEEEEECNNSKLGQVQDTRDPDCRYNSSLTPDLNFGWSPAQLCWMWIHEAVTLFAQENPDLLPLYQLPGLYQEFISVIRQARGGIGHCESYMDTPLSWPLWQLALSVNGIAQIFISLIYGCLFVQMTFVLMNANDCRKLIKEDDTNEDSLQIVTLWIPAFGWLLCVSVSRLCVIGILAIFKQQLVPLGDGINSFPIEAWRKYVEIGSWEAWFAMRVHDFDYYPTDNQKGYHDGIEEEIWKIPNKNVAVNNNEGGDGVVEKKGVEEKKDK